MRSFVLLMTGVLAGAIGAAAYDKVSAAKESVSVTVPQADVSKSAKAQLPFSVTGSDTQTSVRRTESAGEPQADELTTTQTGHRIDDTDIAVSVDSDDSTTTLLSISRVTSYRELAGFLSELQSADTTQLAELSKEARLALYDTGNMEIIYRAVYERWAEIDIESALHNLLGGSENRGNYADKGFMEAVGILWQIAPDLVEARFNEVQPNIPFDQLFGHQEYQRLSVDDPQQLANDALVFLSRANLQGDYQQVSEHRYKGEEMMSAAISQWSRDDPQSAFDFLNSHAADYDVERHISEVLYNWLSHDPDAAASVLESILQDEGSSEWVRLAAGEVYTSHLSQEDPEAALRWVLAQSGNGTLPEIGTIMMPLSELSYRDPVAAQAFLQQLPAELKTRVLPIAAPMIVDTIAQSDPLKALEWVSGMEDNQARQLRSGIFEQWFHTDRSAALDWLGQLGAGPEYQGMMAMAATNILHDEPELAKNIFGSLSSHMQVSTVQRFVETLVVNDPDDAREWLSQQANTEVHELGRIALNVFENENIEQSLNDIAALSSAGKYRMLLNSIERFSYEDPLLVQQWISTSPLLSEVERNIFTALVSGQGAYNLTDRYYQR